MPTIFNISHDVIGEDYIAFIHSALPRFNTFTLEWPHDLPPAGSLRTISQELQTHELGKEKDMILYRLNPAAVPTLLRPGSLFRWRSPDYPENLTFYRDGRSGFSLASFQDSAFILDLAFAHSLPPRISLTEATVSQSLLDKVL